MSDLDLKQRRLSALKGATLSCWVITTFVVLGTVIWAGLQIRGSVNRLTLPGPARRQLMSDLEHRIGHSLEPKLKAEANRTFRDLQPILEKDEQYVDSQAPSAAYAAVDALTKFRDNLPATFAKPFDDRLREALKLRQSQIAAKAGGKRDIDVDAASNQIFDALHAEFLRRLEPVSRPYGQEVTQILDSISKIRNQEAPNVKGEKPTWDMDLMVIEEMHREVAALQSLTQGAPK